MNQDQATEIIRLVKKLAGEEVCKLCEEENAKPLTGAEIRLGEYGSTDRFGKFHNHGNGTIFNVDDSPKVEEGK